MLVRRSLCGCLSKFNLDGLYEEDIELYNSLVDFSNDILEVIYPSDDLKEVNGDLVSCNAIKRYFLII